MMTVVTVTLEDREGGGLCVSSEELPGLILSGPDKALVCRQIVPAIEAIFNYKGFASIVVRATKPIGEVLKAPNPQDVALHIHHEHYVVELQDQAA